MALMQLTSIAGVEPPRTELEPSDLISWLTAMIHDVSLSLTLFMHVCVHIFDVKRFKKEEGARSAVHNYTVPIARNFCKTAGGGGGGRAVGRLCA